jgi:thiol-disulfide isomerase/thioredoxin
MIFLHIDPSKKDTALFNKYIESGKQIFVLFYMEGCGPCNATRPEWSKIKTVLEKKYAHNNNIVVADVDQQLLNEIKYVSGVSGFPTMRYIAKKGTVSEEYEKSSVKSKDRSVDSFIEWIESKAKPYNLEHSKHVTKTRRRHVSKKRVQKGGGKWSQKYRNSINCKRPKGFSQRQFCKAKKMSKSRKMRR